MRKRIFPFLLLFFLFCGVKEKSTLESSLDFTLPTLTGENVTLSKLKGRIILLDFWATWCPPCRLAIPELSKIYEEYKNKNLIVLGIGLDEKTSLLKAQEELKIPYPILIGSDDVAKRYKIEAIPTLLLIDKKGQTQLRKVGFSEEGMKEIRAKIEELISGK
jgi:thiol-disulfide isomerase/thioredoxin|uniref:TlpA family protein disulfide reductase n=1 Tax=candidate division WOR-3 bacterium TaxID=2052148 RepID=A0A7C3UXI4_UNCW3